jgi:hypothetical protein
MLPGTGQGEQIRVIFQITGQIRVTGQLPGTVPQLEIKPLLATAQLAGPEHNLPQGKTMYMPAGTGMYIEGTIAEMFSKGAMASGVVDLQDPQTVREVSSL